MKRPRDIAAAAAIAAALGLLAATVAGPAPALAGDDAAATAREAVFERRHLDNVTAAPATLTYTFRRAGTLLPPIEDSADLDVTAIEPDGRKLVDFRLFSGPNERRFEPRQGYRNNPLIIAFLQRDVEQMGRLTGGSPNYFRNRIREAFNHVQVVTAEPVTVAFRAREMAGTKVTVEPFLYDPNLPRFPEFQRKRYEFVLVPDIPGGVYSLRAVLPGADGGEPLLDESMTYSGES